MSRRVRIVEVYSGVLMRYMYDLFIDNRYIGREHSEREALAWAERLVSVSEGRAG